MLPEVLGAFLLPKGASFALLWSPGLSWSLLGSSLGFFGPLPVFAWRPFLVRVMLPRALAVIVSRRLAPLLVAVASPEEEGGWECRNAYDVNMVHMNGLAGLRTFADKG